MLDIDFFDELISFMNKLKEIGWSDDSIQHFREIACFGTIWECEIPPPIRNRGDFYEWLKTRARWRKWWNARK
jgi:hypothetical protein